MSQSKSVLVTGGAGFLGSHLCDRLIDLGHRVTCVDNLITGNRDNISHLMDNPRFHFLEHDVTEPLPAEAEEIYNLACPASPVQYQRDPVEVTRTSVIGALNVLELARKSGARVLQASTSEIYGDPAVHPQPETYRGNVNPIGPRACYNEGKRCAEALFFDYRRQFGVTTKVVRIFNTYGPRMQAGDGRVISNFVTQALAGSDITVHGDGRQTRSFCYVDDLVDGLIRMMESRPEFPGPVNLGNPAEITIRDLAVKITALCKSDSQLRAAPLPEDDPVRRRPDISLAREELNWEPTISLDEGLGRTVAIAIWYGL